MTNPETNEDHRRMGSESPNTLADPLSSTARGARVPIQQQTRHQVHRATEQPQKQQQQLNKVHPHFHITTSRIRGAITVRVTSYGKPCTTHQK